MSDTARRSRARRRAALALTFGVVGLAFAVHVIWFSPTSAHPLSDIPNVLRMRHISFDAPPYFDRMIEYPVGIATLLWLATGFGDGATTVFTVTAIAACGLALVATGLLERAAGARVWRWVLGPPLLLYALVNWDLFAIVPLLLGLAAFDARRDTRAGIAFGVAAAVKLFPGAVVPPLAVLRLARGNRRGARRLVVASAATFAAWNLPVLIATPSGWLDPLRLQGRRDPTWGSAWSYVLRMPGLDHLVRSHEPGVANALGAIVLVAGLAWLCVLAWRTPITPAGLAGAAVVVFVLSNKVYSPVYDLWLVPFFVLLPVARRLWLAFCAVDLAIFVTVYGYFHGLHGADVPHTLMPWFVAVRTLVLLLMLRAVLSAREIVLPPARGDTRSDERPRHGTSTTLARA